MSQIGEVTEVRVDARTPYIDRQKVINEEFKIWKKSVPLLYDTIQTYALSSPSLTVAPVAPVEVSDDGNELEVKILIGSGSTATDCAVELCKVTLPSTLSPATKTTIPIPSGPGFSKKFSVCQKWATAERISRVRYNGTQLAVQTASDDVKLFDVAHSESTASLQMQAASGTALQWNRHGSKLVSGSKDSSISLWSVGLEGKNELIQTHRDHDAAVNDFSWSYAIPTLFGSVSDDLSIKFYDTRSPSVLLNIQEAHNDAINAIELNSKLTNMFVTGGRDNLINIWDLRNTKQPIRQLYGHNGAVNQLKFNPNEPSLLASSSSDRRIHIWDLMKMGDDFEVDDFIKNGKEDPCLRFIHGGHVSEVNDFSWIEGLTNTLVSVGMDSLLQIWKPHFDEEEEGDEEEEEEVEKEDVDEDQQMEEEQKPEEDRKVDDDNKVDEEQKVDEMEVNQEQKEEHKEAEAPQKPITEQTEPVKDAEGDEKMED